MAKFELRFIDYFRDTYIKVEKSTTELYSHKKDFIEINFVDENSGFKFQTLLDKSTAIKFSKTLRTEINKITESEVYNG